MGKIDEARAEWNRRAKVLCEKREASRKAEDEKIQASEAHAKAKHLYLSLCEREQGLHEESDDE